MNIADILTEWGHYYRLQGQGIKDLMIKLMEKSETEDIFPSRITDATIMEKATAEFTRVLQRFQKAFTPVGGVTFKPTKIELYRQKIDVSEYPDELVESWLGFLADTDELDRAKWPFIRWWLEGLLAKSSEDLEKDEIYWGVPGAITPGTATAARTNMLGIRKQINDGITAGKVRAISMGAVPTNPVDLVDYIEDWWKQIPELLRAEMDNIHMSRDLRDRFKVGMRTKYNQNYAQANSLVTLMDETIQIKGLLSHAGSDKIWATPKFNRARGLKSPKNQNIFKVESAKREVCAFTDFHKGVGFWILEYLYTNDVDLV